MTEEKSPFELDDELEYVGRGRRILAGGIDVIFLMLIIAIIYIATGLFLLNLQDIHNVYIDYNIFYGALNVFNIILMWLYYALMESSPKQATLGKMAFRARVTDEEGNRISFGQATGRYFSKFLSVLILFVGFLMILWDKKQQGLHDKIAKTVVVY